MAIDLASFLTAGQNQLDSSKEATGQVADYMGQAIQGIFNQQANVVQDSNGVTPLEAKTTGLAELEAQNRTQEIGRALGLSPDMSADIQVLLAQRHTDAVRATLAQQDKVTQMKSVGLFDDLPQFLINQVLLPDEINKMNATAAQADYASKQIQEIQADTTAAAVTSKTISTKITQALIDDQVNAVEADIRNKKLQIGVQGDKELAHAVKDLNDMKGQQLNVMHAMLQAQNNDESLKIQRAARADAVKLHNLQMEKYQDEKDRIAFIAETINTARQREGKPLVDPRLFKNVWGTNTAVGKELLADYERGASYKQGLPTAAGETITGRHAVVSTLPPSDKITPAASMLATAQSQSIAQAMEQFKGQKPEVIDAEAQKIFDKKMADWQAKVDPKDQTNPFSILPTAALDQAASVTAHPAWKAYREIVKDNKPFDTNEFLQISAAQIASGKLDYKDVVATVKSIGQHSMIQNDLLNNTYFITGKRQERLAVPVQYESTGQMYAKAIATQGAVISAGAATTGIGVLPAIALGSVTAGAALYANGANTKLVDITNEAQVTAAIIGMIAPRTNPSALFGTGKAALDPIIHRPGIPQGVNN